MKLQGMVTDSYEAFLKYASDANIILLHPRSRYRSVLVARLINDPELNTLYYAMGPDDVCVSAFLTGLTHNLSHQHPQFGHNLNLVPGPLGEGNMQPWLEALAADLREWTDKPFLLILDEYDRSDSADDMQRFIELLAPLLPAHCKLVINSRTLPRLPWVSLIARSQAIILEDEHLIADDFYNHRPAEAGSRLEVTALGPGYVSLDGELITTWEGHLPRLLFFFALDRPTVTRSEICQAFWPELDIEQAVNVFHVTKRRLHKALGEDILVHEQGYYRVNPALAVHYDVVDFAGALVKGRAAPPEEKVGHWQEAINFYRGPFLQGHTEQWIEARRVDFRTGYLEAIMAMAQVRYQQGHTEHALRLYLRALNEDITREDLHICVIRLFTEMGRRSEAAAHYQKSQRELKTQGKKFSPALETVYREIMS
jgi:DNA-binding SARP family transcriptional activator